MLTRRCSLVSAVLLCQALPAMADDRYINLIATDRRPVPIVISPQANPSETEAAAELEHYLTRITGVKFSVVQTPPEGVAIRVGRADRFPDLNTKELGPDALLIEVTAQGVRLAGGDDRGTRYAVTTFLEDLGVHWIMPGEFGDVVPKLASPQARIGRRVERPDFPFREIWYAYGPQSDAGGRRLAEWCRRNKVGGIAINHRHNLIASLPKGINLENHPEYYALVGGRRMNTQVCTTHPDVIRLITQHIIEFFDANPEVLSYSLCPDDNTEFCECDRCRALDVGGVDPYTGKILVTDRYVRFLNTVVQGIQAKHPGKMVTTYAYVNYSVPPQKTEIDPHVAVVFTTSVFCSIHSVADTFCESRQRMRSLLTEWARKCRHLYIYEYDPIPFNAELPCPLYGQRIRDIPVYKAIGIQGFTFESHQSWATLSPDYFINARLMWNSQADGRLLLRDYCSWFFGPAGEAMTRYYDAQERAFSRYHHEIRWSLRDIPDAFSKEVLKEMGDSLREAESLADRPPYRDRVAMVRMACDYLNQYLAARRPSSGAGYQEYRSRLESARGLIDRISRANEDFILAKIARQYLDRSLDGVAVDLYSKDMGLVTNWWLIGPFDNTDRAGHARPYPPEEKIDLAAHYPGKVGEVAWQRCNAPPWKGYVDLTGLMKPKDWVCAYAATVIESPTPSQVQFRVGSNDSIAVFLNGRKVLDRNVERIAKVDDDIVDVDLQQGKNQVLLKIGQTGADWGFFFRVTDRQGNAVKGLRIGMD
jgi:hypothetical protein